MDNDINPGTTGDDSLGAFLDRISGGDKAEAARMTAIYDQHQAFTAEMLSMLDMWITASLVAIDQNSEGGSSAAMMRARIALDNCDHRELQMLLMTLMTTHIALKAQVNGETMVDRLRNGTRNGGFEVFQRFISSGGNVCMHCGDDAEGGYCETARAEVAAAAAGCICGQCPDEGDPLDGILNQAFGGKLEVPDDLSKIIDGTGDQK